VQSRRHLLIKGIGVAAVAVAAPSLLMAERPENGPARGTGQADGRFDGHFSNAVAEGVFSSFSALIVDSHDRANVLVAEHAWRVARDHFNETGFMQRGDQLLRDSDVNDALSNLASTQQDIVAIAEKHGAKLDLALLQARVSLLTPDRVSETVAYLKSAGTAALFDRVLNMFEAVSNGAMLRSPGYSAEGSAGGAMCQALGFIEAGLWVLSGLYALGCAATLGACVACCVASAILAIGAGVVNMIEVVYC